MRRWSASRGTRSVALRQITQPRLHQFRAPNLSPRLTADDRVTAPMRRAEMRPPIHTVVEHHPDRALMLGSIFHHRGLVADVRQMLRMTRRETVVLPFFDVQQLVKRIAVREPRGSFLVGRE